MWQMSPFAWATSTKGCSDVICFVGITSPLAQLLSLCPGWTNKVPLLVGYRRRWAVFAVARMELQQPAKAMIVGSRILPEPKTLQIMSTTLEAEGVHLPPQQLKELKAITAEQG